MAGLFTGIFKGLRMAEGISASAARTEAMKDSVRMNEINRIKAEWNLKNDMDYHRLVMLSGEAMSLQSLVNDEIEAGNRPSPFLLGRYNDAMLGWANAMLPKVNGRKARITRLLPTDKPGHFIPMLETQDENGKWYEAPMTKNRGKYEDGDEPAVMDAAGATDMLNREMMDRISLWELDVATRTRLEMFGSLLGKGESRGALQEDAQAHAREMLKLRHELDKEMLKLRQGRGDDKKALQEDAQAYELEKMERKHELDRKMLKFREGLLGRREEASRKHEAKMREDDRLFRLNIEEAKLKAKSLFDGLSREEQKKHEREMRQFEHDLDKMMADHKAKIAKDAELEKQKGRMELEAEEQKNRMALQESKSNFDKAIEVEEQRQQGRMQLEQLRQQGAEALAKVKAQLNLQPEREKWDADAINEMAGSDEFNQIIQLSLETAYENVPEYANEADDIFKRMYSRSVQRAVEKGISPLEAYYEELDEEMREIKSMELMEDEGEGWFSRLTNMFRSKEETGTTTQEGASTGTKTKSRKPSKEKILALMFSNPSVRFFSAKIFYNRHGYLPDEFKEKFPEVHDRVIEDATR